MSRNLVRDLVRGVFAAYKTADRNAIEQLLSDGFTFTSPYDDHIDRATYFERCWPAAGTFEYHDLEKIVVNGQECFVLYNSRTKSGTMIRNVEHFRIEGGRVRSVEVFFGLPPRQEA